MIATFVLALVAASGFLTVGVLALVGQNLGGHPSEYGLLLGIAGVAEVLGALIIARLRVRTWPVPPFWPGRCSARSGSRSAWPRASFSRPDCSPSQVWRRR